MVLLFFFHGVYGKKLLLPFVSQISVYGPELSRLLSILDDLIVLERVCSVVEFEQELEEFTVPVLRVL